MNNNSNAEAFVQQCILGQRKFWHNDKGKTVIKFYQLLIYLIMQLHVCKVRIVGNTYLAIKKNNIVDLIDKETVAQKFINHIEEEFPNEYGIINKVAILDAVVEKSDRYYNKYVFNHLPIHDITIKHDTETTCYLNYLNGVLEIDKGSTTLIGFQDFKHAILKNRIIRRKWNRSKRKLKGDFVKFVWNLAGHSPYRFKVLCSTIGYGVHNYKDPAIPKMVILIDQVIAELNSNNGGSGKSLLIKGLGRVRNLVELSGKRLKTTSRFSMQRVDAFTDILLVNDASKYENIDDWYNILADGATVERKYEKEQILSAKDSPKVIMTSNHMVQRSEGNSSERRIHEIEVSDYYGKDRNPQDEFGRNLYDDFNSDDWEQFDNFIVFCIQYYLQFGLLAPAKINILKRKLLSEVGIELVEFMDDKLEQGTTKFHKKDTYDEFVKGGFIARKYIPQRNSFTRKLKKYFEYKQLDYTEVPSDSKRYFEVLTEEKLEEHTVQTLSDKQVDYKLVDTPNKLKRTENKLKNNLK